MPIPKQKFREMVFQLLYSYDASQASEQDMISLIMSELSVKREAVLQAQSRMKQIAEKFTEIDAVISSHTQSYSFERIQSVERNILRLGVFELMYDKEIPAKVAISEAIRLARKFSTPESVSFVNAVLDSVHKSAQNQL